MNKTLIAGIAAGVLLTGLILGPLTGQIQFGEAQTDTGTTKKVLLIADELEVQVAPDNALHPGGVTYMAMVWNGTIPGPVISMDQGDTLEVTVENRGDVIHSMDFHAGFGPSQAVGSGNVKSGENKTWTLTPPNAGVFYYHCGADALNGVWEHIANGMYGGIVVHPQNEKPAKEFYVVFGEIYASNVGGLFEAANGTGTLDLAKFLAGNPDVVMTNGMGFKYVPSIGEESKIDLNPEAEVFMVKPNELTRWYIVNAGPNDVVAFHFISGMIDVKDGYIKNRLGTQMKNDETWTIPPGSASVIETTFPEEGVYVGVDHAMNDVLKGAAFAVLATANSTAMDHPEGTWVPPKGSDMVSGPSMMTGTSETNMTDTTTNATTTTTDNATSTDNATATTADNATSTGNTTTPSSGNNQTTTTTNETATVTPTSGSNKVTIPSGASTLTDTAFSPNPSEVKVGDTITWTNDDAQPHTATSGNPTDGPDGKFGGTMEAPMILVKGQTQEFTFTEAGEYDYYCTLHPNMVGTITVS